MAIVVTIAFALAIAVILLFYRRIKNRRYKFPPGPKGLPILGNTLSISSRDAHLDVSRVTKPYGDVCCIKMLTTKIVVLSSAKAIREAFLSAETRDVFAGRPDSFYARYCDRGPSTAFMDFCEIWKEQRKFMVKTLKLFDEPNNRIEAIIAEQLEETVKILKDTHSEPFDLSSVILPSLVNILTVLVTGERCPLDHPAVQAAVDFERVDLQILADHVVFALTLFPFLRHLPFGYGRLYRDHQRAFERYLHYMFDIPKEKFDPESSQGCVNELFRLQREIPWLKDDNIRGMMREIVSAGLGTTSMSVLSFFLIMAHRPDVTKKIQQEIDTVIGRNRQPRLSDKGHMTYTEAATLETLRYYTALPLGVPHTSTSDVHFRDYFLPTHTLILTNPWLVHHDEAVWGDPWEYRPERFLDESGGLLPADSKLMKSWFPFGTGKRACFGESFARSRIFLFITTIFQHFDIRPSADEPLPSPDPRGFQCNITLIAPKFKVRVFPRQ